MRRLTPLAALLLLGCGVSESSVLGTYRGSTATDTPQSSTPQNLEQGLAGSMKLELKPDHTFDLMAMVIPVAGSWSLNGSTVTCTPQTTLGFKSAAQAFQFKVAGDTLEPLTDIQGRRFRFVKDKP